MTSTGKGVEEVLEICHMFADSIVFKQQIYCSFLRMGVECKGVSKLYIFCRRHKHEPLIPNPL